jgi:hypothetical protein
MKTKLQRLKSCRPSPGHVEIDAWIREQETRLGLNHTPSVGGSFSKVTVYPSALVIERLAHFGADRLIANNAAYDKVCEQNDALLAGLIEGVSIELASPRRAKSTRAPRVRRVMVND